MENPFEQRKARKAPRATRLLEIDAWIDSTLYEGGFKVGEVSDRDCERDRRALRFSQYDIRALLLPAPVHTHAPSCPQATAARLTGSRASS